MNLAQDPIGIFDSGIGGLTVAKAVMNKLPHENIIYFGDTAHLPYGDKSTASIQAYSIKITDMLLQQKCKVILIACNSASAAAYKLVREYVGTKAKVVNVIDPVVSFLCENYQEKKVGLIGTKKTVNSNVFFKKITSSDCQLDLQSLATPLLAPMIEEGFFDHNISQAVINKYLSDPVLENIDALVLACTHYPLIKSEISGFYPADFPVIDTSEIVAQNLFEKLKKYDLLNDEKNESTSKFYVSDYTKSFEESTKMFFGKPVHLEHYPIWD